MSSEPSPQKTQSQDLSSSWAQTQYDLTSEGGQAPDENWPDAVSVDELQCHADMSNSAYWFKLQFHTLREGWGGTDGYAMIQMKFADGSLLNPPKYVIADSPGDSHEQGDYDIYLTTHDQSALHPTGLYAYVRSAAHNQIDNWTFELKYFVWSNGRWRPLARWAKHHAYAVNDHDNSPVRFMKAQAHFEDVTERWTTAFEGRRPRGSVLKEIN